MQCNFSKILAESVYSAYTLCFINTLAIIQTVVAGGRLGSSSSSKTARPISQQLILPNQLAD
jgi:hypothetical protein